MSIAIRILIIILGVFLLYSVLKSMIKKYILELHGLFWVIISVAVIFVGVFPSPIYRIANLLGFSYEPALIMVLGCFALTVGVFLCTKWISQLTKRIHELAMQVSLLNQENERIMRRLSSMANVHKTEL